MFSLTFYYTNQPTVYLLALIKSYFIPSSRELLVKEEGVHNEVSVACKGYSHLSGTLVHIHIFTGYALVSFCKHI